jgi:hypothetical protein
MRDFLGAPMAAAARERYGQGLLELFEGDHRDVNDFLLRSVDRLTDKSVGLMQADSVFAGIAVFLTGSKSHAGVATVALILLLAAVGLCCSNLISTSSRLGGKLKPEAITAHGVKVMMDRTIRFTLALYLTGAAFALIILQVLLQAMS